MTWRGTIALAVVLAAFAAAVRWSERRALESAAPAAAPLLPRSETLTAIELHVAGARHRYEHAGGRWRTANGAPAPEGIPALVDALRTLSPLMVVDDAPDEPGEFGLGPDAVRLVAWSGETRLMDLDVGARNPAWTGIYVRRHGARPVEMVGALLKWELAKVLGPIEAANALTKRRETGEPSR